MRIKWCMKWLSCYLHSASSNMQEEIDGTEPGSKVAESRRQKSKEQYKNRIKGGMKESRNSTCIGGNYRGPNQWMNSSERVCTSLAKVGRWRWRSKLSTGDNLPKEILHNPSYSDQREHHSRRLLLLLDKTNDAKCGSNGSSSRRHSHRPSSSSSNSRAKLSLSWSSAWEVLHFSQHTRTNIPRCRRIAGSCPMQMRPASNQKPPHPPAPSSPTLANYPFNQKSCVRASLNIQWGRGEKKKGEGGWGSTWQQLA